MESFSKTDENYSTMARVGPHRLSDSIFHSEVFLVFPIAPKEVR